MRKAFTLIELLVIIFIMAAMAAVAVYSVSAGKDASRLRGGTRDILAKIRLARSMALISQHSVLIEYSNVASDVEDSRHAAQVKIVGAKLLKRGEIPKNAVTLSGERVSTSDEEVSEESLTKVPEGQVVDESDDYFFEEISTEVTTGLALKVVDGDELIAMNKSADQQLSGISAWGTNVGYLKGKYSEKREKEAETSETESVQKETKSYVWQSNGRTTAHKVYVYPEGGDPEEGLIIKVDKYGAVKVIKPEEDC